MNTIDAILLENELKRLYDKLGSDKESFRLSWIEKCYLVFTLFDKA